MVGDDVRDRGITFRAKIDLVESMGAEQYAYFELEGAQVESDELSELAADAGADEVPGGPRSPGRRQARRRERGREGRGGRALGRRDQAALLRPR